MKHRSNLVAIALLAAIPVGLSFIESPEAVASGSVPRPTGVIHSSLDMTMGNDPQGDYDHQITIGTVTETPDQAVKLVPQDSVSIVKAYIATKDWDVKTATEIARCESSYSSVAKGDWSKGVATSLGIFQIHWTVHPQFDRARLFDYRYNIDSAYSLYKANKGFKGPWLAEYLVGPDGLNKLERLAKTDHCGYVN